jgi:hypothetical protein
LLDSRSEATAGQQAFGLVCLLAARLCCDALSAKLRRAGWRLPRLAAHLYSARLASSSQALQASRGVAKTAHVFSRGWRRLCILFGLAGAAGLCGLRDAFAKGAEPMHLMSADGDVFAAAANVKPGPPPVAVPERSNGAATGGRAEALVGRFIGSGKRNVVCPLFFFLLLKSDYRRLPEDPPRKMCDETND